MLSASELRRACQLNSYYAHTVSAGGQPTLYPGWAHRLGQISIVLGISNPSAITAETFAQHVADWQSANGIVPADGILGQRTWAAIAQKARGLPLGSAVIPAWLNPSAFGENAPPQHAASKMVIPGRGWLFVFFHQLPEVGERNLIRKVAVIPNDLVIRPKNPMGTHPFPSDHAMNLLGDKSQFLSTSNRAHGSITAGFDDPAVLIDTHKVKKAGGRVITTTELIADIEKLPLRKPHLKDHARILILKIKAFEGETLIEGTTPRGAARPLSPEHMKYLRTGEKIYRDNAGNYNGTIEQKLSGLNKSYERARFVGRGVGRVVSVVGFVATAYDIGNATHQSITNNSIRPIAAEGIRQVGGWGGAVAGIKLGFAAGAALGIETGPGAIITGGIGAAVCGFLGYTGSDMIADYIYEN